jgi:hypothetical protein
VAQDGCKKAIEPRTVVVTEMAKLPDDRADIAGGDDRLDHRWVEQAGSLSVVDTGLSFGRGA